MATLTPSHLFVEIILGGKLLKENPPNSIWQAPLKLKFVFQTNYVVSINGPLSIIIITRRVPASPLERT